MTCVTRDGRISPGCTGMYEPEHVAAWKRIVDFVHERSGAKICLQLGHSGPKGSTKLMWEGMDEPLADGQLAGRRRRRRCRTRPPTKSPRELTRAEMDEIRDAFVRADANGRSRPAST